MVVMESVSHITERTNVSPADQKYWCHWPVPKLRSRGGRYIQEIHAAPRREWTRKDNLVLHPPFAANGRSNDHRWKKDTRPTERAERRYGVRPWSGEIQR